MKEGKPTVKTFMIILIGAICFLTYNIVLFVLCGFADHGGAFWSSYVFMLFAFITLAVSLIFLRDRDYQPKDWLLGYPVLKHCTIYIILESIVSVLFMILDYQQCPWVLAFTIQMIFFAVHLVFIISCFLAKEMIEDVQSKVKVDTSYFKLLKADTEIVAEKCKDKEVKHAFVKLAEQIQYSDYVRNPALEPLERQISDLVSEANIFITLNDEKSALENCKKAMLLLLERNKKCQALK